MAEDKVLKERVLFGGRHSAAPVLVIYSCRLHLRRIREIQRAKISGFKLDRDSSVASVLLENVSHESQIIALTIPATPSKVCLLHFALKLLLLQRNVSLLIDIALANRTVVERKQERIDEERPQESLSVEIIRHSDAIRDYGFDTELIEDPIEILIAFLCS